MRDEFRDNRLDQLKLSRMPESRSKEMAEQLSNRDPNKEQNAYGFRTNQIIGEQYSKDD